MDDGAPPSLLTRVFAYLTKRRLHHSSSIGREFQTLIDAGEERGLLTSDERGMIEGVLELGGTHVREIMVPRIEIVGVSEDATISAIIQLFVEHGYSRYPVFQDNLDHIRGTLHVKDLLRFWDREPEDRIVPDIQKPAYFVPENKLANELLKEMLDGRYHIAVVTDEYGGTAGLITIEDILEEIVGDILDEHDRAVQHIAPVDENTYIVDARTDIEDVEEQLGIKLPEGDYESVGGFLIHLTGRVPAPSEEIRYEDMTFTIQSADPRRIQKIKVARNPPAQSTEPA